MNKENEKELRKHLELQTKEELIEQIIIQTRTYENALNIIANKNEIIDKIKEYVNENNLRKGIVFKEEDNHWKLVLTDKFVMGLSDIIEELKGGK